MIIIEGPDGAGKTTLIKQLAEEFQLPISPRVVDKDTNSMVDLKQWTEVNVSKGFQMTLFDRHRLISEPIYGSVMRNRFEPGFDNFTWLYQMNFFFYRLCNPLIIYCLPSYNVVKGNIMGDPDNQAVMSKIRRIYSLYVSRAALDSVHHGAMHYDYTEDDPEKLFQAIQFAIENRGNIV